MTDSLEQGDPDNKLTLFIGKTETQRNQRLLNRGQLISSDKLKRTRLKFWISKVISLVIDKISRCTLGVIPMKQ